MGGVTNGIYYRIDFIIGVDDHNQGQHARRRQGVVLLSFNETARNFARGRIGHWGDHSYLSFTLDDLWTTPGAASAREHGISRFRPPGARSITFWLAIVFPVLQNRVEHGPGKLHLFVRGKQ